MKQSTFSAVMANSIKNLWQGYTKGIRFVAVLTVLLMMGIGQAWGAYKENQWGFWQDGGLILTWSANGTTKTTTIDYNKIASGGSLGEVTTSLNLTKTQVKFWRNEHYGNVCSSNVYWELYKGDSKITEDSFSPSTWGNNWDGNNNSLTYSTSIDFLAKTTGPGNYTIRVWAELKGAGSDEYYGDASYKGCGTSLWYNKNSNSYYSITFTIPSKNLTINGATNGNSVSGSVTGITKGVAYTIEATPAEGYEFKQWNITGGSSSITLASNTNPSTTVTFNNYANDATITASFTLKTYTVKWVVNGVETTEDFSHGSNVANVPTIPDPLPCGDVFAGWTTEFYAGKSAPATLYKTAAEIPAITSETIFYAVFADYEE